MEILNKDLIAPPPNILTIFDKRLYTKTLISKLEPHYLMVIRDDKAHGVSGTNFFIGGFWIHGKTYHEMGALINHSSPLNAPRSPTDNYSISYSQFVVTPVKVIQEQQLIIETQNRKIDRQQDQINTLKREVQLIKEKLK